MIIAFAIRQCAAWWASTLITQKHLHSPKEGNHFNTEKNYAQGLTPFGVYFRFWSRLFFLLFFPFFSVSVLLSRFWTSGGLRCRPCSPPGTCLQFLSCVGFSIPTARRLSSNVANSRFRAFRESMCAQEKVPTILSSTRTYALRGDLN